MELPVPGGIANTVDRATPRLGLMEHRRHFTTHCQVRFRALGASGEPGEWVTLLPTMLDESTDGGRASILVREDDGLDLGLVYEFQVSVGNSSRQSQWSTSSAPCLFAVPPPRALTPTKPISVHV